MKMNYFKLGMTSSALGLISMLVVFLSVGLNYPTGIHLFLILECIFAIIALIAVIKY